MNKECYKCLRLLPETLFYRYRASAGGKLWGYCKECDAARRSLTKPRKTARRKAKTGDTHRLCFGCKRSLAFGQFGKLPSRGNQVLARCKSCLYADLKRWRQTANGKAYLKNAGRNQRKSEKYKLRERALRSSPKEMARRRGYGKAWRARNLEKDRIRSVKKRIKFRDRDKKWRQEYLRTEHGKAIVLRWTYKRRARFLNAICTLTATEWAELKAEFHHACAYCRQIVKRLTMDHVIPVSKNGNHTKENIVPACMSCNAKKSDKIVQHPDPDGPILVF